MTRDDIIRMAATCGIPEFENNESQADNIIRFANLVAAAEREACAKECEDEIRRVKPVYSVVAENVLKAIRARGEK